MEVLRQGARAWNDWREHHPSVFPNLTDLDLPLGERQFGRVNGGPINLKAARLTDAFLRFATLSDANLEDADFSEADLVHARLDGANLRGANLRGARLDHADFAGARLDGVKLGGASLLHARNLTQEQLEGSVGDHTTLLPSDLQPPKSWSRRAKPERLPHVEHAEVRVSVKSIGELEPVVRSLRFTRPAQFACLSALCLVAALLAGIVLGPRTTLKDEQIAGAPWGAVHLVDPELLNAPVAARQEIFPVRSGLPADAMAELSEESMSTLNNPRSVPLLASLSADTEVVVRDAVPTPTGVTRLTVEAAATAPDMIESPPIPARKPRILSNMAGKLPVGPVPRAWNVRPSQRKSSLSTRPTVPQVLGSAAEVLAGGL